MRIFKKLTILSLVLLSALMSSLVSAHSGLKSSMPENGAILNKGPETLQLEFKTPIKLIKLQLIDESGKAIKLIKSPNKTFNNIINVELPVLDIGNDEVKWMVMGKDTHKMKGNFSFMVHSSDM